MRYVALATDYDGTLATHGVVTDQTVKALEKLRDSGRKLLLVTGRDLPDLKKIFPRLELFDRVVAENGGLLYRPATNEEVLLAPSPPPTLLTLLNERGVPFSVGRGIVATWEPHEEEVLAAIKRLGLEMHVIFNKGAVMVLPSGVNKATGMHRALQELGLSEHNVVGVGDAENDHAFLSACEFGAAVANALEPLKDHADLVTKGTHGEGVEELITAMLDDDLRQYDGNLQRHAIVLGRTKEPEREVTIAPYRGSILIAGPSGSGKSSSATALLERFMDRCYQFCLIDPEGDYENLPDAIILGTAKTAPSHREVLKALCKPEDNVVVNLLGMPLADRPGFCATLLPRLLEKRSETARPHFIVVDEAHHLLPSSWRPAKDLVPQSINGFVMITVHPDSIAKSALEGVEVVLAVGKDPGKTFSEFASVLEVQPPKVRIEEVPDKSVAMWRRLEPELPVEIVAMEQSKMDHQRHTRKYAEGDLGPDRSFYFTGPNRKLKLKAQNLHIFLQLAEGVDDETWLYHLRRGEYSRWFRDNIKDDKLAREAEQIERNSDSDANGTRERIREAIDKRYTTAA